MVKQVRHCTLNTDVWKAHAMQRRNGFTYALLTAVAAVILFRLATFWIPLLPGYGAFVILQRTGDL